MFCCEPHLIELNFRVFSKETILFELVFVKKYFFNKNIRLFSKKFKLFIAFEFRCILDKYFEYEVTPVCNDGYIVLLKRFSNNLDSA